MILAVDTAKIRRPKPTTRSVGIPEMVVNRDLNVDGGDDDESGHDDLLADEYPYDNNNNTVEDELAMGEQPEDSFLAPSTPLLLQPPSSSSSGNAPYNTTKDDDGKKEEPLESGVEISRTLAHWNDGDDEDRFPVSSPVHYFESRPSNDPCRILA